MDKMKNTKVVITGIGIVSTYGTKHEIILDSLLSNARNFDIKNDQVVCPINNFNPKSILGRMKELRYVNRGSMFGICAAELAIKDAKLSPDQLSDSGLFIGTGPNFDFTSDFPLTTRTTLDHDKLQALFILKYLPNTMASMIAKRWQIHGETATIGNACAASTQAIGEGYLRIKSGRTKIAIVGGGDSRIQEGGLLAYQKASALHQGSADSYIPFSQNRQGFVPGEGAAFLILEEKESALKRKAKIYGEILGFGSSMDAHAMTAPDPTGFGAKKAIRQALQDSTLDPNQINTVFAHGTGTLLNDKMEASLISNLFPHRPFVTSLKSRIGHLSSACGAMESAIPLLINNKLPQSFGLNNHNKAFDLNFENQPASLDYWVVQNFGFGGQNSALVFGANQ